MKYKIMTLEEVLKKARRENSNIMYYKKKCTGEDDYDCTDECNIDFFGESLTLTTSECDVGGVEGFLLELQPNDFVIIEDLTCLSVYWDIDLEKALNILKKFGASLFIVDQILDEQKKCIEINIDEVLEYFNPKAKKFGLNNYIHDLNEAIKKDHDIL